MKKIMFILTVLWLFTAGVCFSKSLQLTKVGEWGTGDYRRMVVQGNYAYCLSANAGLDILDISKPTEPIRVGSLYSLDGFPSDVFVSGNHAFMKYSLYSNDIEDFYSILRVVDISNPRSPRLLGRYKHLNSNFRAAGVGEFVYVANTGTEISTFKIDGHPILKKVRWFKITGKALDIAISGNYAYIAAGDGGFQVLGLTPNLNYEGSTQAIHPERVIISGKYAYLSSEEGIHTVDISNPRHPILKGTHYKLLDEKIMDYTISGNYAYIIAAHCHGDCDGKKGFYEYFLKVIDLTAPNSPITTVLYLSPKKPTSIAMKDQYVYITLSENGFLIYDMSDPFSPVNAGSYDETEYPKNVAVSGKNAYLIGGESKFLVMDISNPSAPKKIGKYTDMPTPTEIAISGHYAYLVNNEKNFYVLDISRPEAPVKVGMYTTTINPSRVAVSGERAYVADSKMKGIEVVNIANPAKLSRAAFWKGSYDDVAVSGDHVYAAQSDEYFADLKNGNCRIYSHIQGICIYGKFAFLPSTSGCGKIIVVKLSDMGVPFLLKQIYTRPYRLPLDMAISNDYAFVIFDGSAFQVRKVSNPKYPGPFVFSDTWVNARRVEASGNYAYLTGGGSGKFYIFQVKETSGEPGDAILEDSSLDRNE
ncbi:MAG TPA: hypothetical protein VK186_08990 [Candidatus Deferrimicrobium sp.]|nr:hypothetical protein [Candidatus Deferrimicrobium sp.]